MSMEDARVVDSIADEYAFIASQRCACGGRWERNGQTLHFDAQQTPFDRIAVRCGDCGAESEFWFNCSRFFGTPPSSAGRTPPT